MAKHVKSVKHVILDEETFERLEDAYHRAFESTKAGSIPLRSGNYLKNLDKRCRKWRNARTEHDLIDQRQGLRQLYCALARSREANQKTKEDNSKSRRMLFESVQDLAEKEAQILSNSVSSDEINDFVSSIEVNPKPLFENGGIVKVCRLVAERVRRVRFREEIMSLVQTDPTAEYPQTREMKRHFTLHIGPTNSGKTYESLQRLRKSNKGVYLSPLRLLALEVYDTLMQEGINCSMITGEERFITPDSHVISQTVETLDINGDYDYAVIDECQMIADEERGHAWTKAILGIKAPEISLCASADVKDLLISIIKSCNDTFSVVHHARKTPLVPGELISLQILDLAKQAKSGDCFIAFSKKDVLDMASRLELAGIKSSIIYGKLPPETRRHEVEKFNSGKTKVVVATDAIGMGVNLPIRRIVFTRDYKFDGRKERAIRASEFLQIAGRAGRYGKYDQGIIATSIPELHERLGRLIKARLQPVNTARIGFPRILLDMDGELDEILKSWASINVRTPYRKISIEIMLKLYQKLKAATNDFAMIDGGDDKHVIYSMISCPFDERNKGVEAQWIHYCMTYTAAPQLEKPVMPEYRKGGRLEALENYYKLLDLYHLFSTAMQKEIDEKWLYHEKRDTEKKIETMLSRDKKKNIKTCRHCGSMLPLGYKFAVCDRCYDMGY